jgi:phosphate:Na+ symporter
MSVTATACAGLGIFFVGMRLISSHLKDLASGGIRRLLTQAFHRPGIAPLAGLVAGAVTQSTSAVTFIATGLVSAGALSLAVAVSMLAWANAGTSALVLLASFDVHALALYLLALIGLAFFNGLDQSERYRHVIYAVFGLGLLLYGLTLIKGSVGAIRDDFWVREFVEFAGSSPTVSLLTGYVLAIALQSSSVVAVLALPLAAEGIVDLQAMSALIVGACAGSGTAVVLVSSGLEGPARQLAMTQGLVRGVGSLCLLPLVLAESQGHPVGLAALAEHATDRLPTQVGLVFLYVQLVGIVVAWGLRRPILGIAARFAPPSPAEQLSRPAYLYDEAIADPNSALELLRLEHVRLITALPEYLEDLRDPAERSPDAPTLKERASASAAVVARMEEFLTEILRVNPDMSPERVFDERRRLGDLKALQKTLAKFAGQLLSVPASDRPPFARSLVEGLHALLMVVGEACGEGSADARQLLVELTAERGALVDRVRRELLGGAVTATGKEAILSAVLLLERMLWMLRERSPLPASGDATERLGDGLEASESDTLSPY